MADRPPGSPPDSRWALVNGRLILPDRVLEGQALLIEGERILGVAEETALPAGFSALDVGGRFVAPGLIDLHTHGASGHTFNEPSAIAYHSILAENARRGVTALLATIATAPLPEMLRSLAFARDWLSQSRSGTRVLGVHLEGPYFCFDQRGAHDPAYLRPPDDGSLDSLLAYQDVIRLLSFAPELPGALALTRRLAELNIIPAAGHSCAKEEQVKTLIQAGLCHMIHIWSGQSTTIREGPWRKPGLLEVSLTDDRLSVEMICDNRHLPQTLMQLAYKCIGPDRLCAVSDATNGAGLPEGARYRMGQMEYEICDGVGMTLDHTNFAGSTTLLNEMLPVLVNVVGVPLPAAVRMASLTPARVLGIAGRKGSLEAGKDADIAIFDPDFRAWGTIIKGCWEFAQEEGVNDH